jgi:hypothetical protein
MNATLPWVDTFLKSIRDEYALDPPNHVELNPTDSEIDYVLSQAVGQGKDPFDKGNLKGDAAAAIESKKAKIIKSKCLLGEIFAVSFNEFPFHPPWNTWWRAVRLIVHGNQTKVRIIVFGHPRLREAPAKHKSIGAEHVNGGSAMRCDPRTIVIYRKEEATRVLIHELLHASCTDPYHKDTPNIEADTEAWAELILCGMAAKGVPTLWNRYLTRQLIWATRQAATLRDIYRVKGSDAYAWRYLVGRIDVWKRLGLYVPPLPNPSSYRPTNSLRFTLESCEPKND